MRVAIVTDAWEPQVNGVVRTLGATCAELRALGHSVEVIEPSAFPTVPCPTYAEIRLALATPGAVGRRLSAFAPDAIHLATEGPLCLAARVWCLREGLPFTTAFHTSFPDYVAQRTGLSPGWFWPYFRWFHGPASAVLASTPTIRAELAKAGIPHTRHWGRGVDHGLFRPYGPAHPAFDGLPRPILLNVGRVAVEKNIEAFLKLDTAGTKVIVGDGPARPALERAYPVARFLGVLAGEALAAAYRGADALIFPSRTDTFGLVMIEAMSCGTPVAAMPVPGPLDVLNDEVGCMDEDLSRAVAGALGRDRAVCAAYGAGFGWRRSACQFLSALRLVDRTGIPVAA
jgi:glycosyltransferase involved in cell wall biosynthesis